jgi:hypothetical protein
VHQSFYFYWICNYWLTKFGIPNMEFCPAFLYLPQPKNRNHMNVKKLMINTLLMGAVAAAPVGLSSCDDDDGGNGGGGNGGGPDISENSGRAILSDGASDTIASANEPTVIDSTGGGQIGGTFSSVQISFSDEDGNSVGVTFSKSGDGGAGTGTYDPISFQDLTGGQIPDKFSQVSVTLNGTPWSSEGDGSVEVTTNNSNKVAGTINNVTLSKSTSTDDSTTVTVNGAFDASK